MSNLTRNLSNAIRFLSIDAVEKAKSGHPGMPMGMADVMTILFKYYLKFNPKNPSWINRDRFILFCRSWIYVAFLSSILDGL